MISDEMYEKAREYGESVSRITSYNVCYTKLLRNVSGDSDNGKVLAGFIHVWFLF